MMYKPHLVAGVLLGATVLAGPLFHLLEKFLQGKTVFAEVISCIWNWQIAIAIQCSR